MSFRPLLRKHAPYLRPQIARSNRRTLQSSFRTAQRLQSSSTSETTTRARIDRVLNRLPRFLHPYTNGLRNAPVSHVTAFLILHEITAIVPLFGLAGLFHYTQWIPASFSDNKFVSEGLEKFGRYFRRKGWFGFSQDETSRNRVASDDERGDDTMIEKSKTEYDIGGSSGRILVEIATAYAITKVFLPARIVLTVWGTPWFARTFIGRLKGIFRRKITKHAIGSTKMVSTSGKVGKNS